MIRKNITITFFLLISSLTVSAQQKTSMNFSDKTVDSVLVNSEFDWNGSIVDMPIYNPTWPDAQIRVMDFPEGSMFNMPVVGMKEKKGNSLKSGKYPFKNGPGNVNKDQKDKPAKQE